MGIKEVLSAPRSPWQRSYVERVIGTIRREYLDHVMVLGEASLYRHLLLSRIPDVPLVSQDTPEARPVQPRELGTVIAIRQVGGLHDRYERRAA